MARYIDADLLKEEIKDSRCIMKPKYLIADEAFYIIDSQPAADVVEVVRCKDCDVPHNKWTGCPYMNGLIPPADHFCSYGEKRS